MNMAAEQWVRSEMDGEDWLIQQAGWMMMIGLSLFAAWRAPPTADFISIYFNRI